jgi:hypothetical protein
MVAKVQADTLARIQPRLTKSMINLLHTPVSLDELTKALSEMARQKSLGLDGVLTKFYQALWPTIGKDYWRMLQDTIGRGTLPRGVTNGIITLLHKDEMRNSHDTDAIL